MQTFFVNGRLVKSQLLTAALEEAYANRIMKGKFPGCVLWVTLPPDTVDVNVHPAKTVVKFVNDKQIFDLVYHGVMDALDREAEGEGAPKPAQPLRASQQGFYQTMSAEQFRASQSGGKSAAPARTAFRTSIPAVSLGELGGKARVSDFTRRETPPPPPAVLAPAPVPDYAPAPAARVEPVLPVAPAPAAEPEQTAMLPAAPVPWRIAGEVLDTYIVCEDSEHNVWLIDKHAAHERVNFDRFKAQNAPIMSQTLLTPLVAQLGAAEFAAAAERFDLLREFGFECEDFGDRAVLIRAIPADIDETEAVAALEEIAGKLALGQDADPDAARDALLATLACKAAIKGGWKSDERELRALVDRVQSGEIEYCPHGRPVKVKLSQHQIEKMFKRIV